MKKLFVGLAALLVFCLPDTALADTIVFTAPVTAANNNSTTSNPNNSNYAGGANQFDLDHQRAYTWQINNVSSRLPAGQTITGATLTFSNMRNWDTNPNRLFVHLLDSARTYTSATSTHSATVNGVTYFQDASGSPVTDIRDAFASPQLSTNPLVAAGTGNTFLFDRSFSGTAQETYIFTFNQQQLAALIAYIANNNNLAFGFDPDCHFWNNGIKLTLTTAAPAAVPEPATMTLLGTGLAGLYYRRRRKQQQQQRQQSL
ncbi:MAG TPA: PEP-CTERM sorting domain-containing protein [Pyrinomonadaceae bacterium]|nr:PEP-CTERM sorting domain-containing protein [Pyrinomonadaceae bacterium]